MEIASPQKQPANSQRNPADHLVEHRFQPGQSGNPGGRPKGRSIAAILRELLDQTELGGQKIPDGKRAADMLGEALLKHALKGDIRHIQEVLNRTEGKVPDRMIADVTSREPIRFVEVVPPADNETAIEDS